VSAPKARFTEFERIALELGLFHRRLSRNGRAERDPIKKIV